MRGAYFSVSFFGFFFHFETQKLRKLQPICCRKIEDHGVLVVCEINVRHVKVITPLKTIFGIRIVIKRHEITEENFDFHHQFSLVFMKWLDHRRIRKRPFTKLCKLLQKQFSVFKKRINKINSFKHLYYNSIIIYTFMISKKASRPNIRSETYWFIFIVSSKIDINFENGVTLLFIKYKKAKNYKRIPKLFMNCNKSMR